MYMYLPSGAFMAGYEWNVPLPLPFIFYSTLNYEEEQSHV